jgi:hypothetical protein
MINGPIIGVKGAIICKKSIILKILGKESKNNWNVNEDTNTTKDNTPNTRIFLPW